MYVIRRDSRCTTYVYVHTYLHRPMSSLCIECRVSSTRFCSTISAGAGAGAGAVAVAVAVRCVCVVCVVWYGVAWCVVCGVWCVVCGVVCAV